MKLIKQIGNYESYLWTLYYLFGGAKYKIEFVTKEGFDRYCASLFMWTPAGWSRILEEEDIIERSKGVDWTQHLQNRKTQFEKKIKEYQEIGIIFYDGE